MKPPLDRLASRLQDARGKRVIFVSHCILNENTRYLGGAFASGALPVLNEIVAAGVGVVQMKCPEQLAWGGVHKKYMWASLASPGLPAFLKRFLFPFFLAYTRFRFRRLARQVCSEISDYIASEYEVVGILGIDGSPSCGVTATLDLAESFRYFSTLTPDTIERDAMNRRLYGQCLRSGQGIFMAELQRGLERRGIRVPSFAHSLVEEMNGAAPRPLKV